MEGFPWRVFKHSHTRDKDPPGCPHSVSTSASGHKIKEMVHRRRTVDEGALRTLVAGKEKNGQYLDSDP
jgi:hypothetical protein